MTKVKEICQRCENVFLAGPKQFYCPECLHEMAVERGRKGGEIRMTLNGAIKQLHDLRCAEDMPVYYKLVIAEVINVLLNVLLEEESNGD